MKTSTLHLSIVLLILSLSPAVTPSLFGQAKPATSAPPPVVNRATPASTNKLADVFSFPGGHPRTLLQAVQKAYGVDWLSLADIPPEMERIRIPRFRIDFTGQAPVDRLQAIVRLYNKLGEEKPELGKIVVEPESNYNQPSIVMLVPNAKTAQARPKLKVQAFTLAGIPTAKRELLRRDIAQATEEAFRYTTQRTGSGVAMWTLEGEVAIHDDTGLLVAIGPEPYVEMVSSIVTAYQIAKGYWSPQERAPARSAEK